MSHLLDVYLGEAKAGALSQDEAGALSYAYDPGYIAGREPRAISFSMPLQEAPYADRIARPFFSGLLPDEGARQRLAGALGISAGNAFGLLEVIGGECAGALSLYPAGQTPPSSDGDGVEALGPARLEEILGKLRERPLLGGEEGVRLSLAGAQDKLAVCVDGETIGLAKGGRPTTHILKPFIQALDGTVENELFCLRLAARLKLPVPRVEMRRSGTIPFLLVERYDRSQHTDGTISRLHQEDFCQALSVPPELKYEEEGGPGTERSLDLIDRASARPAADRLGFIRMLIFHYLVGNADAHGKNYALLYRGKAPDLAPLYDVVCTAAYPRLAKKLAMAIGGRSVADTIQLKHWLTLVPDTRAAQRLLVGDMTELAGRIGDEADKLLAEFEDTGIAHEILKANDVVIGNGDSESDTFYGGAGIDTLDYSALVGPIIVDLGMQSARGDTIGTDSLAGIENASGGGGNDHLIGSAVKNILRGGLADDVVSGAAGNDNLSGGAGNDSVIGVTGNDVLSGDAGNDTLSGGEGIDVAAYSTATAAVGVNLSKFGNQDTGGAGVDNLRLIENLFGSTFDDVLSGSADANLISAGSGNDSIFGASGRDKLDGGFGNDTINGGVANDALFGRAGRDRLEGSVGNDVINGGIGNDLLLGGDGSDILVIDSALFGSDTVTGFQDGLDIVSFSKAAADSFDDLHIIGNGTTNVTVSIEGNAIHHIALQATTAITLTSQDFFFEA